MYLHLIAIIRINLCSSDHSPSSSSLFFQKKNSEDNVSGFLLNRFSSYHPANSDKALEGTSHTNNKKNSPGGLLHHQTQ